jgi:branched-chain amino acid transport system substrate-binding protein
MRRRILSGRALGAGCVAAALIAGAAACSTAGTGAGTGAGGAAVAASKQPLVIGISLSLTGDFGDTGQAAEKGYELWADQVNKAGGILGRQVQLKIVDDTTSATQVVTNYESLITQDHVDLVFGPVSSLLTVPAARIAARYGYAFIEPAGGAPSVFALHLHNLFLAQPAPVLDLGVSFADYILSLPPSQRPKTAAYSSVDNPFASPVVAVVQQMLQKAGIKTVLSQTYPSEQADLGPVVARVVAADPDLVVDGTQGEDGYETIKDFVQQKFSPKFLFMPNDASDPVAFPANVGMQNVNGIYTADDWSALASRPGNAAFIKAYLAKYGGTAADIDPTSAEAYACGQLLQEVAAKTGSVANSTIISALHSGTWSTIEGNLSWNADGATNGTSGLLLQWQNHQLIPVYPTADAAHAPENDKPGWGE